MTLKSRLYFLTFIFVISFSTSISMAQSSAGIPPKPCVSDGAYIFGSAYDQLINRLCQEIDTHTGDQIVIRTIPTLNGESIDQFASDLFATIGPGREGLDNGVLIVISREEKQIRIEVGYGLEAILNDAKAGRILDENAIPMFKENEYGRGTFLTVLAIGNQLLQHANIKAPLTPPDQWPEQPVINGDETRETPMSSNAARSPWWLVGVSLAVCISFFQWMMTLWQRRRIRQTPSRAGRLHIIKEATWMLYSAMAITIIAGLAFGIYYFDIAGIWTGLGAITLLIIGPVVIYLRWADREEALATHFVRTCLTCRAEMSLLSEKKESDLLTPIEKLEEKSGGINYEIWMCHRCLHKERYAAVINRSCLCPSCHHYTVKTTTKQLSPATFSQSGREEHHQTCLNPACEYEIRREVIIPRKSRRRSSSHVGGGFGSGGSSGSGFGGGSSGGGGASRSW